MHGLPITAAVREVLALLQLRLHQGTADTGVAVSVHPVVNHAHEMQTWAV